MIIIKYLEQFVVLNYNHSLTNLSETWVKTEEYDLSQLENGEKNT